MENKGPYLIKNTLTELSKYDKLFFFDSKDEIKLYMESLNEMDYYEWKQLDLILYNLEMTKIKIKQN